MAAGFCPPHCAATHVGGQSPANAAWRLEGSLLFATAVGFTE